MHIADTTNEATSPQHALAISEADIYAACREFVVAYALPPLDPDNVFQGWQNRAALPAGTEDYAVISIVSAAQHGTTVETFSAPGQDTEALGTLKIEGLMKVAVLVDFCGETDLARLRAQRCAIVAHSSIGVDFFNKRGLSFLYADDVREHCSKSETKLFVRHYATVLHVSVWSGDSVTIPYFDKVSLARLENVDAHHKPQEI